MLAQVKGAHVSTVVRNDSFLRVCRGETSERTPVWFMRQAGRSLPEYRALREKHSILDLCRTPELATEVTLQPIRRLGVDAAILFSDIVIPLAPLGIDLDIKEGVGPVIANPVRTIDDVRRLRPLEPDDVDFTMATVSNLKKELEVPLIGFAGAPFTLASYIVEGGPSKDHARTKSLMRSDPETWNSLMELLAESVTTYLSSQVGAGADAIQLFDSWVGALSPQDFDRYVRPHVERIFTSLDDSGVPRIYFGVVTGELLARMSTVGTDVLGVDWRVPLDEARQRVGASMPLQGNLDPTVCLAPWEVVEREATEVLRRGSGGPHVFNLGHGVLPAISPDTLARLVDLVHEWESHG